MTSPESPKESAEGIPPLLQRYEKWWGETYGREATPNELKELNVFARELAKEDEKFKQILAETFLKEFSGSDEGLEDPKTRKWILITALSTYGKEFGLKVD